MLSSMQCNAMQCTTVDCKSLTQWHVMYVCNICNVCESVCVSLCSYVCNSAFLCVMACSGMPASVRCVLCSATVADHYGCLIYLPRSKVTCGSSDVLLDESKHFCIFFRILVWLRLTMQCNTQPDEVVP